MCSTIYDFLEIPEYEQVRKDTYIIHLCNIIVMKRHVEMKTPLLHTR